MAELALECPICFGDFKKPKMIPCGHSFCLLCLQQLTEGKSVLKCPVCCIISKVPSKGFESYPTNYALVVSDTHTTKNLEQCPTHKQREVEAYCHDCQVEMCLKCCLQAHKDHSHVIIEDSTDQILQNYTTARDKITHMSVNLDKDLSILRDTREDLKRKKDRAMNTANQIITTNFNSNFSIIKNMVDTIEERQVGLKSLIQETESADHSSIAMLKSMSKLDNVEDLINTSELTLPNIEYLTFQRKNVDSLEKVPYDFPKFQVIQKKNSSAATAINKPVISVIHAIKDKIVVDSGGILSSNSQKKPIAKRNKEDTSGKYHEKGLTDGNWRDHPSPDDDPIPIALRWNRLGSRSRSRADLDEAE